MSALLEPPDSPPADLVFRRRVGARAAVAEVWRFRELLRTLAEREIRARYKQALLGFSWAVITPLVLMVVFSVFVRRVADVDTGDVPYPLFAYLGLLPWTFFSTSLSAGGQSLVTNSSLLNKIYCPREVFPLASVVVAGVDTIISTAILGVLFGVFTFMPKMSSLWVPALLLIQLGFTIAVTLIVSGVLVYLRDLRQALPLLLQFGLFATPVAWGIDVVPPSLQVLYSVFNPLAPVIDGYRRTILFDQAPQWDLVLPAAASTAVLLGVGYVVFKRLETGFADAA